MQPNIKERVEEKSGIKGHYVLTIGDVSSPEAQLLQSQIVELRDKGDNAGALLLVREFNKRFTVSKEVVHNLVPTVGRTMQAARLAGTTTLTGVVNKVALGTNSSTPVNADTQLGTETYRNTLLSATYASNIAYLTGFFTAAEVNGTFSEVGLFVDGTASANTGTLFSHALASITKSSIQTLTIDWVVTIS